MLNLVLWTAWFFLAATVDAHAGPIVAAVGAIATAVASLGAVGQFIIGVGLSFASSLLQKALQKKPKEQTPGVQGQLQVGGDNPLSFIVGTFGTAGQLEYVGTWGNAGGTPNAYLTLVVSLSDLPISGLSRIFTNGQACSFADGPVASGGSPDPDGKGYVVNEFVSSGVPYMWVKFYDGTQTEADDQLLLAKFGLDPDRPWQADMIGRGIPYVAVTMRLNRELFTSPPSLMFEVQGIKLYDIRKDTTAGGDGAHRWDDQSTWEFSDNPKVINYNLIRGVSYNGEWIWGGQNIAGARLPASTWMAAANECDVLIDLAGDDAGTEKQFRAGGEITVDQVPLDVVEEFDKACNGHTIEVGGFYKTHAGATPLPVYAFADEDIVVTKPQDFDPFPGLEQTQNGIHATYPEPEEAWADKDAPPRYFADYEAADDGRRLLADVKFPVVPYGTQVQRLMEATIRDGRNFRKHQFYLPPEAWLLEPVIDTVSYTSARNGYDAKTFMIGSMLDQPNCLQQTSLQETDPGAFDWDKSKQLPTSIGPLTPMRPASQPMTGWQVAPGEIKDADGTGRRPSITIGYAGNLDDVAEVRVQVKLAGAADTDLTFDGNIAYGDPATNPNPDQRTLNGTFMPDTDYVARGKFIPFSGRATDWSGWLSVRTPNIKFGLDDFENELRRLIAEEFMANLADARQQTAQIADILARLQSDFELDKITSTRSLQRAIGQAAASFTEQIAIAVGQGSALATLIESLDASIGDIRSSIKAQWVVGVTPSGAIAAYELTTTTENAKSGLRLVAINDGGTPKGEMWVDADKFLVGKSDIEDFNFVPMFTVDTVNKKIYFSGDLFADGSIASAKISTGTLSAIAANLGTVTAGRMLFQGTGSSKIDINAATLQILISDNS